MAGGNILADVQANLDGLAAAKTTKTNHKNTLRGAAAVLEDADYTALTNFRRALGKAGKLAHTQIKDPADPSDKAKQLSMQIKAVYDAITTRAFDATTIAALLKIEADIAAWQALSDDLAPAASVPAVAISSNTPTTTMTRRGSFLRGGLVGGFMGGLLGGASQNSFRDVYSLLTGTLAGVVAGSILGGIANRFLFPGSRETAPASTPKTASPQQTPLQQAVNALSMYLVAEPSAGKTTTLTKWLTAAQEQKDAVTVITSSRQTVRAQRRALWLDQIANHSGSATAPPSSSSATRRIDTMLGLMHPDILAASDSRPSKTGKDEPDQPGTAIPRFYQRPSTIDAVLENSRKDSRWRLAEFCLSPKRFQIVKLLMQLRKAYLHDIANSESRLSTELKLPENFDFAQACANAIFHLLMDVNDNTSTQNIVQIINGTIFSACPQVQKLLFANLAANNLHDKLLYQGTEDCTSATRLDKVHEAYSLSADQAWLPQCKVDYNNNKKSPTEHIDAVRTPPPTRRAGAGAAAKTVTFASPLKKK